MIRFTCVSLEYLKTKREALSFKNEIGLFVADCLDTFGNLVKLFKYIV